MYNAGSDKAYELANEQIAWDDANSLVVAANKWIAGGPWQPILDYYFGTKWCQQAFATTEIKVLAYLTFTSLDVNPADFQYRASLTNAINVHSMGIPIFRSRMFIYLHEIGKYGPYGGGESHCKDSTFAYSFKYPGTFWVNRPDHILTDSAD